MSAQLTLLSFFCYFQHPSLDQASGEENALSLPPGRDEEDGSQRKRKNNGIYEVMQGDEAQGLPEEKNNLIGVQKSSQEKKNSRNRCPSSDYSSSSSTSSKSCSDESSASCSSSSSARYSSNSYLSSDSDEQSP